MTEDHIRVMLFVLMMLWTVRDTKILEDILPSQERGAIHLGLTALYVNIV